MPRGVKQSPEDKLKVIGSEIKEMEERKSRIESKLAELYNQQQEILDDIEQSKLIQLSKAIHEKGITPEQAIELLQQAQ